MVSSWGVGCEDAREGLEQFVLVEWWFGGWWGL